MVDALNKKHVASALSYMAQSQASKFGIVKFGNVECAVPMWFAVQDAYDKLNAEGAFEIGGKLFGMHDEEQAEHIICYDEGVSEQCVWDENNFEEQSDKYQNQVCQIIKLLKRGTRVDF